MNRWTPLKWLFSSGRVTRTEPVEDRVKRSTNKEGVQNVEWLSFF